MRSIPVIIHESRFEVDPYWVLAIKKAVKEHGGPIRGQIQVLLPESRSMRKYVMGALVPLLVYLDGNDYKDSDVCEFYFWHYKKEFTPEAIKVGGKVELKPKSSKGSKALKVFAEKLQEHLSEQYGIDYDSPVTSPEHYRKWAEEMSMATTGDYLDYCRELKLIK